MLGPNANIDIPYEKSLTDKTMDPAFLHGIV